MRVKFGEISIAVMVVAIVLVIILPIPGGILDVLLALNIALAIVILLNVVIPKNPFSFQCFRQFCCLPIVQACIKYKIYNIDTGRREAGQVMKDLETLLPGNLVVGTVIFLIITSFSFW